MWLEWEDWASCNVTCGGGVQSRNRTCDGPYFGGLECSGTSVDFQTCGENPCPSRCLPRFSVSISPIVGKWHGKIATLSTQPIWLYTHLHTCAWAMEGNHIDTVLSPRIWRIQCIFLIQMMAYGLHGWSGVTVLHHVEVDWGRGLGYVMDLIMVVKTVWEVVVILRRVQSRLVQVSKSWHQYDTHMTHRCKLLLTASISVTIWCWPNVITNPVCKWRRQTSAINSQLWTGPIFIPNQTQGPRTVKYQKITVISWWYCDKSMTFYQYLTHFWLIVDI